MSTTNPSPLPAAPQPRTCSWTRWVPPEACCFTTYGPDGVSATFDRAGHRPDVPRAGSPLGAGLAGTDGDAGTGDRGPRRMAPDPDSGWLRRLGGNGGAGGDHGPVGQPLGGSDRPVG